ncbi:hypothetical protein TWF506_000357 [Arthrobotrys conoides]|uniref:Extracellular membrane protein CFEM domain-containing protein n=1 Tax=Arthrobotrys conoides TaxID=74498 RepID=A0AAN8RQG9_9PEZI
MLYLTALSLLLLPLLTIAQAPTDLQCSAEAFAICGPRAITAAAACTNLFNTPRYEPCVCGNPEALSQFSNTLLECLVVECTGETRQRIADELSTLCDDIPDPSGGTIVRSSVSVSESSGFGGRFTTMMGPSMTTVVSTGAETTTMAEDEPSSTSSTVTSSGEPPVSTSSGRTVVDSTRVVSDPTSTTGGAAATSSSAAMAASGPRGLWGAVGGVVVLIAGLV